MDCLSFVVKNKCLMAKNIHIYTHIHIEKYDTAIISVCSCLHFV